MLFIDTKVYNTILVIHRTTSHYYQPLRLYSPLTMLVLCHLTPDPTPDLVRSRPLVTWSTRPGEVTSLPLLVDVVRLGLVSHLPFPSSRPTSRSASWSVVDVVTSLPRLVDMV